MEEMTFGRYRLLAVIGEGAMGRVYKAHDTVIDRDVAVKVLPTALAQEPGYRQRFRREAHTAARLTEPHIIPIYDTGEVEGQLYLVMPIVDGIDVHGLLRRDGPLSPPRAVHLIEQLAAALDAAHIAGLVHRDVKPSNALLTGDDFAYLIDFGIAHDASATRLTNTGMIVGTLAYMAPERFTAGTADARTDIYALTCVLHECLTGATPFPGDSLEQQIAGHLTLDPPKPASIGAAVPAGFDEVIAKGMAKNPDQRYRTAHDLAAAAQHALAATGSRDLGTAPTVVTPSDRPTAAGGGVDQFAPPDPAQRLAEDWPPPQVIAPPQDEQRPNRRRMWLSVAAVALLVAAALTVYLMRPISLSEHTAQQPVAVSATPASQPQTVTASPPQPTTQLSTPPSFPAGSPTAQTPYVPPPTTVASAAASLSRFAGTWAGMRQRVVVDSSGSGRFTYMDQKACPSCSMAAMPYSTVSFEFTSVSGDTASGSVTGDSGTGGYAGPVAATLTSQFGGQTIHLNVGGRDAGLYCSPAIAQQCGS
ncbi:MAG: protein kinase [Nocardia sp.]|nr:protein kinase [Nocardia sp.]